MNELEGIYKLQEELLEFGVEVEPKNISMLKSYTDITKIIDRIEPAKCTMFLYSNKSTIHKILNEEDKIVRIKEENLDNYNMKSLFYLALDIKGEEYFINYSYSDVIIKNIYSIIKKENKPFRKFMLSIIYDVMLDNYQNLDNSEDSITSEELDKISKEIKSSINDQLQNLEILESDKELPKEIDIENFYIKITIYLIKKRKIENFEYTKDIMEQLDLENIELTNKIYTELKKVFDDNEGKEDYLAHYRIKNFDNLNNEKTINFYFILFKYIFKDSIYIYNIKFLLDTKKAIIGILRKDNNKIEEILKTKTEKGNEDLNARKQFMLKKFLDSEYYSNNLSDIFKKLKEILKYFENFCLDSKNKEIKDIEEILQKKDNLNINNNSDKYMSYYNEAYSKNKRYNILRYINDIRNKIFTEDLFQKTVVKFWDSHERFIHEKKTNITRLSFRKEIYNYFSEEKNKEDILQIFDQDEVDLFIKNYNLKVFINIYYQNYFFESKKKEIEKINNNKDIKEIEEYLKDLESAKKMNEIYRLISKVFQINKESRTEKEVNNKLEEWKTIEKMLEEKRFDIKDDNIKINLFLFFNDEKNINLLKKESYDFLLNQRKEVEEVILNYYKAFYPESKKGIIELIEKGQIKDDNLKDYFIAKKMNLRKPLIYSLSSDEKEKHEREMLKLMEKYKQIEDEINKENFSDIQEIDMDILYEYFENKEKDENKFIKEIFGKDIIDKFIKFKKKKKEKEKTILDDTTNKQKSSKKKHNILKTPGNVLSKDSKKDISNISNKKDEIRTEKSNMNKEEFILNNIFEYKFGILLYFENKKIFIQNIYIMNKKNELPIMINEAEFYKCKELLNKSKESKENKIFEYVDNIIKGLIAEYNPNFKFVLGLIIEKTNIDYSCKYELFPPSYIFSKKSFSFKEDQITANKPDINKILSILKEEERNCPKKNNDKNNNQQNKENLQVKTPSFNDISTTKISDLDSFYFTTANSYQVLRFIKVIGNHNERNKKYTAEFIKELKNCNCFISGGTDKTLKIYYDNYSEKKPEVTEIKDWIYCICESIGKTFLACANKVLYLFSFKEDGSLVCNTYELTNMTCISVIEMNIKEKEKTEKKSNNRNKATKQKIENKEKEEKIVRHTVIVGRNGLIDFESSFSTNNTSLDKAKYNHYNKLADKTYRNIIKLNEHNIAITSNSVIPGGENKLIIFNLFKKEIKETIEGYSFIASTNGMTVIKEKYLLCACKSYSEYQKNGILLVILNYEENTNSKAKLFDTGEFEVYCFCPIKDLILDKQYVIGSDYSVETDFFFVGGFDKKKREGKIKLFRFEKDEFDNVKGIKYLQDIDIDKTEEILRKDEEGTNKTKERFEGFKGAISSMIQSTGYKNILVSCYDGKIYLLSKPNLLGYNIKLNY